MKSAYIQYFLFTLAIGMGSEAYAHSQPLNDVAVKACQEKAKSQVCQYTGHHNDLYMGTCQLASEKKLICVRNKPIQKIEEGAAESSQ